jgi:hypothetical protein
MYSCCDGTFGFKVVIILIKTLWTVVARRFYAKIIYWILGIYVCLVVIFLVFTRVVRL